MPPNANAPTPRSTRLNPHRGSTPGPGPTTVAGRVTRSGAARTVANPKASADSASVNISGSKPPSLKRTTSEALTSSEGGESDGEDEDGERPDADADTQDAPNSRGEIEQKGRVIRKKRKRRRKVKAAVTAPVVPLVDDAPTNKSKDKGKRKASVSVPSPLSVAASASTSTLESTSPRRTRSSHRASAAASSHVAALAGLPTAEAHPEPNAQPMNLGHSNSPGEIKSTSPGSASATPGKSKDKGKGKARATTPPATPPFSTASGSPMTIVEETSICPVPDTTPGPSNQIDALNSATDALKAEIARLKREVDEHKRLPATLTQHVTCLICLELLWRPFGVVPCGHVVCYGCLVRWFCAPPPGGAAVDAGRANVNPMLDAGAGGGAANGDAAPANAANNADGANVDEQDLRRILDSPLARQGAYIRRAKTCPVCRCVVRERPVELWSMKAVVASVGRASGLEDPSGGANLNVNANANINQGGAAVARENDPWRNIFGPPARRQHGRQPFMDPWAGAYDEDDEDENDFEPHNIHDHRPHLRQRILDFEDLSDEEDFDEDGLDEEEFEGAIDDAVAYWEGAGRGPMPIAERMGRARALGQGQRDRRRGAIAGAGAPADRAAQGPYGWHDAEDGGIYRCWDCMHEIWDGYCAQCGRRYPIPQNRQHDLALNDDPHGDLFVDDEAALEEEIAWLHGDADEDEEDEELHGGGFEGVYRRRPYDYEVDVDEEDEEAEPGEFDGWLDDDDGEGGLRGEHEVFHDALEGDDDDDPDGDIYADEWHGLHHRHPHHYHRNRVMPVEDDDEVEVVDDGPYPELLSDGDGEDPVQIAQRQPNARNADRRLQLAALRRRGLLVSDDEENAEDDDGEESDTVEVVEQIPRARHARRRYVETTDEEEEEPPLRVGDGGLVPRRVVESSDDEEEPLGLRAAARRFGRVPARNPGANVNVGNGHGQARRAGRALVLSDDEEEDEAYALPQRRRNSRRL